MNIGDKFYGGTCIEVLDRICEIHDEHYVVLLRNYKRDGKMSQCKNVRCCSCSRIQQKDLKEGS
jgi:hypothetical protein